MEIKNNPNWNPSRDLYSGDIPPANNALVANLLQALLNSGRVEDMKVTSQNLEGVNPMQDVALGGTPMLMGISRSAAARKLGQMLQMSKRDPKINELLDFIPKPMMDKVSSLIGNFDRYVSYRDKALRPLKNDLVENWDAKKLGGLNTLDGIILQKASTPAENILAHEVGHSMASLSEGVPPKVSDALRTFTNISVHNMDELIAETYNAVLSDNKQFVKAVSSFGPEYQKIVRTVMNDVGNARMKDVVGAMDAYRKRPLKNK